MTHARGWPVAERWLAAATAAGLLSLLLVNVEALLPGAGRELRPLATVQPAALAALALLAGNRLAPTLGLGLPLLHALASGGPAREILLRQLRVAVPVGIVTAGLLLAWNARMVPELAAGEAGAAFAAVRIPLVTRLLYGGIVEEVLLRWGVLTGLLWLLWRAAGRPERPTPRQAWAAIAGAALLFGLGHLPLLALLVPDPAAWKAAAVVLANAAPGLAFGWLFWRLGLEAAILAHALAHLLAWIGGRLV
ncbi:CPBP family glutamic-type intramembrane protease [Thermaurantiacus sp.]